MRTYGITASTTYTRTQLAVSVADVKQRARVTDNADDNLFEQFIEESTDALERETARTLITKAWKWTFDDFPPSSEPIKFPRNPLLSVSSVSYYNSSGDAVTWASSEYDVDTTSEPGRLMPGAEYTYPTVEADRVNGVTVTFRAGYGTSSEDVPPIARKAIANMAVTEYTGCDREGAMESWRNALGVLRWD